MIYMNTTKSKLIPPSLFAELQEAADNASQGVRDIEKRQEACAEMDRIREEIRAEHGVLDIGVAAIREIRDA
jgi:hypothetical protein